MVVMPVDLPLLTITVQCWQTSSESAHCVVCLCLCMAWCTLSSLVGALHSAHLLLCHGKGPEKETYLRILHNMGKWSIVKNCLKITVAQVGMRLV